MFVIVLLCISMLCTFVVGVCVWYSEIVVWTVCNYLVNLRRKTDDSDGTRSAVTVLLEPYNVHNTAAT